MEVKTPKSVLPFSARGPPSNTPISRPTSLTTQTASRSNHPIFHNLLTRQTDRWDRRQACSNTRLCSVVLIESDAVKN